jgi:hypothetical protein
MPRGDRRPADQLLAALLMPLGGEAPGSARRSHAETGAHFRSR